MIGDAVCVHGLGYIGLPTAAMLANHGYSVVGFDTNDDVLNTLDNGEIHIDEPGLRAFVAHAFESGNLEITSDVTPAAYHLICVPTPFDESGKAAELSYVEAAAESISDVLETGNTVILESTVPPTTTADVVRPILEQSGHTAGVDFDLVYCPETVLPGNIITELKANDRIVGSVDCGRTDPAIELYDSFVDGAIHETDATTAEFVKLIQNTYRDTNIALANELAKIAADYDINSRQAIELANRHPRVGLHNPGPGVGGHCLPIDPWFLSQHSDASDLIEHARQINDGMVSYVCDRVLTSIKDDTPGRVALLGVAYKGDVSDYRRSPGLEIAEELAGRDGDLTITVTDPYVDTPVLDLEPLDAALAGADVAVLVTDHSDYQSLDPVRVGELMEQRVLLDTRAHLDEAKWTEAGFDYWRL